MALHRCFVPAFLQYFLFYEMPSSSRYPAKMFRWDLSTASELTFSPAVQSTRFYFARICHYRQSKRIFAWEGKFGFPTGQQPCSMGGSGWRGCKAGGVPSPWQERDHSSGARGARQGQWQSHVREGGRGGMGAATAVTELCSSPITAPHRVLSGPWAEQPPRSPRGQ